MTVWQEASGFKELKSDRIIDIWRANLNLAPETIADLASILSPDELARANKFRFAKDKKSFIAARGILRQILSKYIKIAPQKIEFKYSDRGKPELATTVNIPWQFNLSHSQEYALYGITRQHLIGVDLEYLREMPDAEKIAQRFFSPREYNLISNQKDTDKSLVFFQLWTAKEAYLKAIGTGLSGSLTSVEIALNSQGEVYLNTTSNATQTKWTLHSCIPAENYLAAIATNQILTREQVSYWHWY